MAGLLPLPLPIAPSAAVVCPVSRIFLARFCASLVIYCLPLRALASFSLSVLIHAWGALD